MSNVRVAIIGVGNCASALMQGVSYCRHAADDELVPGLMHLILGGYHLSQVITKAPGPTTNIVSVLQEPGTDVVVNDLPVGA